MSKSQINSGESGIILAVVLIMLGIIVALVIQAQILSRSYLNLEASRLIKTQLRETAGDGAWQALNTLAADEMLLIDHTNEAWAAPIFLHLPNGIDAEINVVDENRFLDANMLAFSSPSEQWRPAAAIIRDLLAGAKFSNPEMRTEIIRDWVDQNQEGVYEKAYYLRRQELFFPEDLPMESTEELLWLLDATTNASSPAAQLTVLPSQERSIVPLNVNTADRRTLLAVFGENNSATVERIIRGRDAAPILNLTQVLDPVTMRKYSSYLTVRSSFFSVYAMAEKGLLTAEIYCLAKRDSAGNVRIIRWVER